jgi:lysophospholipase L1-like esterase
MNNKKTTGNPSSTSLSLRWLKKKCLAFVGDSITADLRWNYVTLVVDQIADQTDICTMSIVNSGIDSSSILDAMDRLPEILVEHDPDVLIVFVGVNDRKIFRSNRRPLISAEVFAASYAAFLDLIDSKRCRQKVLVTPPPLLFDEIAKGALLQEYWHWSPTHYADYIKAIRGFEKRKVCAIADVYATFLKESNGQQRLFDMDGVHPNIYGHRLIASTILEALDRLGKGEPSRS